MSDETGAPIEDEAARKLRLEQEIEQYRDDDGVHDLPPVHHYWSERYVKPKLQSCGFGDEFEFYLKYILRTCAAAGDEPVNIVSLGSGNGDLELVLAAKGRQLGVRNFVFHCLELNPHMIERARRDVEDSGLGQRFTFEEVDLATWTPSRRYDICIAHHCLHHMRELDDLFAAIKNGLWPDGLLLTNDMIGRNGHMRWPEALSLVEELWRELPRRCKFNQQLMRFEDDYVNFDCAAVGSEGIRSQDILPLLMEHFHFEVFVGFANLADVFVGRAFGPNFDLSRPEDLAFVDRVARMDDEKIDGGEIKPTHMAAVLRPTAVAEIAVYRGWTPEHCVRRP